MPRRRTIPCLTLRVASLTIPLVAGYAAGTVLLISWMIHRDRTNPRRNGFESDALLYRYGYTGEYASSPVPSYFVTVLAALLGSVIVVMLARHAWPRTALVTVKKAPEHDKRRFRHAWRAAFSRTRPVHPGLLTACFVIGISGTIFGLGLDQLMRGLRETMWRRNGGGWLWLEPRPVLGWLTWSEIVWFVPAIGWAVYWWYVRPARRIMLASGPITRRWCRHCGFHLGLGKQRKNTAPARCPECGKETGPVPN